jgi:hypothetical protein
MRPKTDYGSYGKEEATEAYFIYRWLGGDDLTHDQLVGCDYFVPNRENDPRARTLTFPCPVCNLRYQQGLKTNGEQIDYFDGSTEQARNEIRVDTNSKDFDVLVGESIDAEIPVFEHDRSTGKKRYLRHEKKRLYGLVTSSDRWGCRDCEDAQDGHVFDVVFPRAGLAVPSNHAVSRHWSPIPSFAFGSRMIG